MSSYLIEYVLAYEAGETNSRTRDMKKTTIKTYVGKSHDKKVFFTNRKDKNHDKCPAFPAQFKRHMRLAASLYVCAGSNLYLSLCILKSRNYR